MEPFNLLIALLPLAAYLTFFGANRLMGRPMVTTGGRDIFALAIAISGLVAVGPAELFFPVPAATALGAAIWPVLAVLYLLIVLLVMLSFRPRLIVYGRGPVTVTGPLLRAAQALDPRARADEAAGCIELPDLRLHLRIEGTRSSDAAEIFVFENGVTPSFWNRLLAALRVELAREEPASPRSGAVSFALGIAMLGFLSLKLFVAYDQVVQGFQEWLWR